MAVLSIACAAVTLVTLALWKRHMIGRHLGVGIFSLVIVIDLFLGIMVFREYRSN
jgi:hypothetical protein